jgi:hypothetical protein
MPTSTKRAPAASKKTPVKVAGKVAEKVAKKVAEGATKPFMRFHHTPALRTKTLVVLEAVESAEDACSQSGQLAGLVLELTDCGLDQYFVQPLKAAKVSFVVQQSAALGLVGVQKVMGTVIRNVMGRMSDKQLLSVCGSIRQFMA